MRSALTSARASVTLPIQSTGERERDFFIDNLLVQIHFIIVMIRWTESGLVGGLVLMPSSSSSSSLLSLKVLEGP